MRMLPLSLLLLALGASAEPPPQIHMFGDDAFDADVRMPLVTGLDGLPTSGVALKRPWSGYWWPYRTDGLTRRWISPAEPSPIEKLDRVEGHPNAATSWELGQVPVGASWGGQCDGFAIASIVEPEPRFPVMDGGICFAAGDVQGLLGALYEGDMTGQRVDVLGRNAYDPGAAESDLDPATFHLALANVMGTRGEGIYLDVGKRGAMFNKPVAAYTSRISRHGDMVEVSTELSIVKYLLAPPRLAPGVGPRTGQLTLTYELELDDRGSILPGRGHWTGKSVKAHPTSMKIPRGSPAQTPANNPYIDADRVRLLAARSASALAPECWPGPPEDEAHRGAAGGAGAAVR